MEIEDDGDEQEACLDLSHAETEAWLRRIKLWEFANLPWSRMGEEFACKGAV